MSGVSSTGYFGFLCPQCPTSRNTRQICLVFPAQGPLDFTVHSALHPETHVRYVWCFQHRDLWISLSTVPDIQKHTPDMSGVPNFQHRDLWISLSTMPYIQKHTSDMSGVPSTGTFGFHCPQCPTSVKHTSDISGVPSTGTFGFIVHSALHPETHVRYVWCFQHRVLWISLSTVPYIQKHVRYVWCFQHRVLWISLSTVPYIQKHTSDMSGVSSTGYFGFHCPQCPTSRNTSDMSGVSSTGTFGFHCPQCPTSRNARQTRLVFPAQGLWLPLSTVPYIVAGSGWYMTSVTAASLPQATPPTWPARCQM